MLDIVKLPPEILFDNALPLLLSIQFSYTFADTILMMNHLCQSNKWIICPFALIFIPCLVVRLNIFAYFYWTFHLYSFSSCLFIFYQLQPTINCLLSHMPICPICHILYAVFISSHCFSTPIVILTN